MIGLILVLSIQVGPHLLGGLFAEPASPSSQEPEGPAPKPQASAPMTDSGRLRGKYHIGDGYMLEIALEGQEKVRLRLFRDDGLSLGAEPTGINRPVDVTARPEPGVAVFGRHRPVGRLVRLHGEFVIDSRAEVAKDTPVAYWQFATDLVHVYLGSRRDDQFQPERAASHRVYLGMGGFDSLLCQRSYLDGPPARNIWIREDGRRGEFPKLPTIEPAESAAPEADTQ